jgi:hypothetical protein
MMRIFICLLLSGIFLNAFSQGLDLIEEEEPITAYTSATFKTNRLINAHSIETVSKGEFDFKISHRFGLLNGGFYDLFGLDQATMRMGGDFGVTDQLNIGFGRSTVSKTYDGFIKYQFLRQSTGKKTMPVTAVWLSGMSTSTTTFPNNGREYKTTDRFSYVHQLMVARKFTEGLSLQLTPTLVHQNMVDSASFANNVMSMGLGLRQKLTTRTTVNIEYFYVLPDQLPSTSVNALSIGFDIETGGHVFQLFFTNAESPFEQGFITNTKDSWLDGDIRFGFNIARIFDFSR